MGGDHAHCSHAPSVNKVNISTFVCQQSQDINKSDSKPLSKPSGTLAYNEYLTSVTTDLTSMTTELTSMTAELTTKTTD